ncbi:uncharacterized protein LOC131432993 [Malaya genurostris]|uniref:uncharacterized protein LOC131432993 n=1 Tax=Malaya genurostris TaxID=325434 RepID=UPI0026F38974|nr:uncharacterized protein LOC131432993 [Malaya genurostris]
MVHDVAEIPLVAKLQFLLQSLEGEARKPYETVDIESSNYITTWEALLKRYDNKRFLKKQFFRTLHDIAPIRKESSQDLHNLVDDFQRHVKALAKLGEAVETWDTPLVCMLSYKIDSLTLRAWEEYASKLDNVGYDSMVEFLYQRVRILQTVSSEIFHRTQTASVNVAGSNTITRRIQTPKLVANTAASSSHGNSPTCISCSDKHLLFQCPTFQGLPVGQRRELISNKRLCWNCFKSSHIARNCDSKYTYRHCHERHHTLLHQTPVSNQASKASSSQQPAALTVESGQRSEPPSLAEVSMPAQRSSPSTVFLSTVALWVEDKFGKPHLARALIDSGSQSNFISKRLAHRLFLRPERTSIPITDIGEATVTVTQSVACTIRSKNDQYSSELQFLVLPKPTAELPSTNVDISSWKIPSNITLADPTFNISGRIDILLGIEHFHEYLRNGRIILGEGSPVLFETVFGWAVIGRWYESVLERFWQLETVELDRRYSAEELMCERLFETTTSRNRSGRYVVRLPRTDNPKIYLGESRSIAEKRFLSLERRFSREEATKSAYLDFMDEYLQLNHMCKIDNPINETVIHSYLPHHPVFKTTSSTTKTRVVFDASCRTTSGYSLNDLLLVGPVVQQDLLSIVLRFRIRPIALVADIEKMYRQIEIHQDDRALQRILWRRHPLDPITTYELRTVTHGTASAPFLATRTLIQLAKDEGGRFPMAKDVVQEDFYVDDLISGSDNLQKAIQLRRELSPLECHYGNGLPNLSVTTLGLVWEPNSDILRFKTQLQPPAAILTRRNVLSYIAQMYDPLGLIGPVISTAKQFMQRLWALSSNDGKSYAWDEPLPEKIQREWKEFHATLNIISDIRVPRFISAYGACVYLRSEDSQQNVYVHLLAAKSKVAPLKTRHSIARLELCAALLATQLFKKVFCSLKVNADVFFWVDSMTVLQWLKAAPSCWKTFVGNRVSKIQESTTGYPWNHVPGKENPADELSRGLTPYELLNQKRWWTGPTWIKLTKDHWPKQHVEADISGTFAVERKACLLSVAPPECSFGEQLFNRYSSYTVLRRTVAYILRYMRALHISASNTQPDGACAASSTVSRDTHTYLTTDDLQDAELTICRLSQRETFSSELNALRLGKPVGNNSAMKWIKPIMSSDGLIRVGGRIRHSGVPDAMKHPIVISSKQRLAHLLAVHYHTYLLHAGPQLMMCTIKQKFWLIAGRDLLRQVYHQCHTCFRHKPVLVQQTTADLPSSRVTPSRPFAVSGIDYCGPLYLRGPYRRAGAIKAYIAVFVCFSTRAVHLELVSDLSAAAFLAALKRFIARRGMVRELHSDNATNFKGASNELNHLYKLLKTDKSSRKLIFDWCANVEIVWKFIPPRAPHFGGLWEAAVESAKNHLLKEVRGTTATQEEMLTLLAQVEMCLNSRPIVEMSNDPSDLEALTPGHFLVGANMQTIPEVDYKHHPDNRLNRWQLMQKRLQAIWKRWSTEYLQQLQARSKKGIKQPVNIEVGRLVIIKDDNLPPAQWPLGRIIEIHPNQDGIVRVVSLKTSTANNIVRPVTKIVLLPMTPCLTSTTPQNG